MHGVTYYFTHSDRSVEAGVRRIAVDQIDKAIAEFEDRELDAQNTVHQIRKRCKKLRGLIRLVRPGFADYSTENHIIRDAASRLSVIRDTQAKINAFDTLIGQYANQIEKSAFASVRRCLVAQRRRIRENRGLKRKLSDFHDNMVESRHRATAWTIDDHGFEALAGGLGKTYKRARKAMYHAEKDPAAAKLHEWRKRIKYHWYHARLLREAWPEVVRAHRDAANDLAERLGEHHDLAVLLDTLLGEPAAFGAPADLEALVGLIERRQAALQAEAFALGRKVLAERRSALLRRWGAYWAVWESGKKARKDALAA
jgi:CHAD domain-containing protein